MVGRPSPHVGMLSTTVDERPTGVGVLPMNCADVWSSSSVCAGIGTVLAVVNVWITAAELIEALLGVEL